MSSSNSLIVVSTSCLVLLFVVVRGVASDRQRPLLVSSRPSQLIDFRFVDVSLSIGLGSGSNVTSLKQHTPVGSSVQIYIDPVIRGASNNFRRTTPFGSWSRSCTLRTFESQCSVEVSIREQYHVRFRVIANGTVLFVSKTDTITTIEGFVFKPPEMHARKLSVIESSVTFTYWFTPIWQVSSIVKNRKFNFTLACTDPECSFSPVRVVHSVVNRSIDHHEFHYDGLEPGHRYVIEACSVVPQSFLVDYSEISSLSFFTPGNSSTQLAPKHVSVSNSPMVLEDKQLLLKISFSVLIIASAALSIGLIIALKCKSKRERERRINDVIRVVEEMVPFEEVGTVVLTDNDDL